MMRRGCAALAVVLVVGTTAGRSQNPVVGERKYLVEAIVCQGDPQGDRGLGTLRHLAEPRVVVAEGKEAWMAAGGKVTETGVKPPYFRLLVTPEAGDAGAVRVRIVLRYIERIEEANGGIHTRGTESVFRKSVTPGEVVRVTWPWAANLPGGESVWADVTVHLQR